jgi:hypothetical protein
MKDEYLKTSNYCYHDIALKWKEHMLDFLRTVVERGISRAGGFYDNIFINI